MDAHAVNTTAQHGRGRGHPRSSIMPETDPSLSRARAVHRDHLPRRCGGRGLRHLSFTPTVGLTWRTHTNSTARAAERISIRARSSTSTTGSTILTPRRGSRRTRRVNRHPATDAPNEAESAYRTCGNWSGWADAHPRQPTCRGASTGDESHALALGKRPCSRDSRGTP